MEYGLLAVVALQFVYIVYKDYINAKEREKLQLKLMSRDVGEYKAVVDKIPEDAEPEPDPYIPAEDATIDEILKAEDRG